MRKFKFKGQKGLSLVEVTIMLLVLMLLTSVLAPSIFDFVIDAKWVKVKEDCEAIGISVARLTRDVGPCLKFTAAGPCTEINRVDLLYSDGPNVTGGDVSAATYGNANIAGGFLNWHLETVEGTRGDWMENQFVTNAPLYNTPLINYPPPLYPVGPLFGLGWRGAYLAPPIGPDPWGHRYMVNSAFLAVAVDSAPNTHGGPNSWWEHDVFCISPGPNGLYETAVASDIGCPGPVGLFGACRTGDDFIYVIQGSGR